MPPDPGVRQAYERLGVKDLEEFEYWTGLSWVIYFFLANFCFLVWAMCDNFDIVFDHLSRIHSSPIFTALTTKRSTKTPPQIARNAAWCALRSAHAGGRDH